MPLRRLQLTLLAALLLLVPGVATAQRADPPRRIWARTAQENDLPFFVDVAIDEARQRVYAAERSVPRVLVYALPSMQLVGSVELGDQLPTSLAISADGRRMAVGLGSPASVAIVDLDTLSTLAHLSTAHRPTLAKLAVAAVVYGPTGRLFVLEADQSEAGGGSTDWARLYTFDTDTGAELGRSELLGPFLNGARVTATGDRRTLYVASAATMSTAAIFRLDITSDTPWITAQTPAPGFPATQTRSVGIATNEDGSLLFSSLGEVWSGDLGEVVAALPTGGDDIAYASASRQLFVGGTFRASRPLDVAVPADGVVEVDPDTYSPIRALKVDRPVAQVRVSSSGGILVTSTDLGLIALSEDESGQVNATWPTLLSPPESADLDGPSQAAVPLPGTGPATLPQLAPVGNGVVGDAFGETFDAHPGVPMPFRSAHWDVTGSSLSPSTWWQMAPFHAAHGDDCAAPPAMHLSDSYDMAAFVCAGHLMTSIQADQFGAVVLTPDHLVDFSSGEARVDFDLSTYGARSGNWVELWLTPFEEAVHIPSNGPAASSGENGPPRHGVQVVMHTLGDPRGDNAQTTFSAMIVDQFIEHEIPSSRVPFETVLQPSASRRDHFQLRVSRTHLMFGMPEYNLWWIDSEVHELPFNRAAVQLIHGSLNSPAFCTPDMPPEPAAMFVCDKNTWHWGNVAIEPSVPFTIVHADRSTVDATSTDTVNFETPAPAGAHLRFLSMGDQIQVSFDDGRSWQLAQVQPQSWPGPGFHSVWTPVPEGATSVRIRGFPSFEYRAWLPWFARDFSIWALPPAS